jgi:RecB family exonuclease
MVEALHQYLSDFRKEGKHLLSREGGFELDIAQAKVKGYIDRVEEDTFGRVVIVDLKTGKYPPPQGDIPEHAQLACYQLAVAENKIEGLPENVQPGGAKLLYVTNGVRGKLYRECVQEEYDEEALDAIRKRIEQASLGMAGSTFLAPVYMSQEISNPFSRYEFRIHSIPGVSAS